MDFLVVNVWVRYAIVIMPRVLRRRDEKTRTIVERRNLLSLSTLSCLLQPFLKYTIFSFFPCEFDQEEYILVFVLFFLAFVCYRGAPCPPSSSLRKPPHEVI